MPAHRDPVTGRFVPATPPASPPAPVRPRRRIRTAWIAAVFVILAAATVACVLWP